MKQKGRGRRVFLNNEEVERNWKKYLAIYPRETISPSPIWRRGRRWWASSATVRSTYRPTRCCTVHNRAFSRCLRSYLDDLNWIPQHENQFKSPKKAGTAFSVSFRMPSVSTGFVMNPDKCLINLTNQIWYMLFMLNMNYRKKRKQVCLSLLKINEVVLVSNDIRVDCTCPGNWVHWNWFHASLIRTGSEDLLQNGFLVTDVDVVRRFAVMIGSIQNLTVFRVT